MAAPKGNTNDILILVSNVKAKGGFVLVNTITKEAIKEGGFFELSETKRRLKDLGYGIMVNTNYGIQIEPIFKFID